MRLMWVSILCCALFGVRVYANQCVGQINLQVLGSGGPELDDNRASSSYLIWRNNAVKVLLDTGSGSSVQFGLSGAKFEDIDVVLLSHLHSDHSADLPAFVKGSFFTSRQQDLWVLGPKGNSRVPDTVEFVNRLFAEQGAYSYLSDYLHEGKESYLLKTENAIAAEEKAFSQVFPWGRVVAIPVSHGPIPAVAWKIEIDGCVIVYSGDMSNRRGTFSSFAKNADLMIAHLAIPETAGRIAKNLHMPPSQIAKIIEHAQPKQLLLSHFMKRSERNLEKSIAIISNDYSSPVYLAEDLFKLSVSVNGHSK